MKDEKGNPVMIPGSLKAVKAIGWFIEEYGVAQISMNLTNISVTRSMWPSTKSAGAPRPGASRVTGSELVWVWFPCRPCWKRTYFLRNRIALWAFPTGAHQDRRQVDGSGRAGSLRSGRKIIGRTSWPRESRPDWST
ncbi:MAG: hypothetical protein R2751_08325 [Bacteroidales bacterium]